MLPARTDPSWNFDRISEGLRTRDPATIHHLIDEYGNAVLAVVRSRLPAKLRREFDSLDFTQEVWAGLASGNREATAFRNRDEVVAYLSQMARNRVISAIRRRLTGVVHSTRPEVPLGDSVEVGGPSKGQVTETASQFAVAQEQWEALVADLSPAHRAILERIRDGGTQAEIAEELGVSLSTVTRIVRKAKQRCGIE